MFKKVLIAISIMIMASSSIASQLRPGLAGTLFKSEDFTRPHENNPVYLKSLDITRSVRGPDYLEPDDHESNWSARWAGLIEGPYSGEVTITSQVDSGIKLTIDGKVVIDGLEDSSKRSGKIKMSKGKKVPVVIEFICLEDNNMLRLYWQWSGQPKSIISDKLLSHDPASIGKQSGNTNGTGRAPIEANFSMAISPRAEAYLGKTNIGPQNVTVSLENYEQVCYVSQETGSDTSGNGTRNNPWATVVYALSQITNVGSSNTGAVLVAKGTYSGATIEMKKYVDMYGGFNATNWNRDIFANKTILNGQLARRVMIAADNCMLDGFVITRGRVGCGRGLDIYYNYDHTGCGAGIAIINASPVITNCMFTDNMTTKPVPWDPKPIKKDYDDDDGWHQTANDGGAISIFNHANPIIANCIFYDNKTEAGRGAAISSNYYCNPVIANNVMFNNIASTNDPMRSGDGGAINAYEYGYVIIQNNIIANNKAKSRGDGGGCSIHWWVSALIKDNVVVNNLGSDDGGGIFVAGQKHHWEPDEPKPPYPEYKVYLDGNVLMANEADNSESDPVRFTKLVVAEFTNNIIVDHSKGLYFQNSTVDLINNTIGGKPRIENDKPYQSNPRCNAYNNIFLDRKVGSGSHNFVGRPEFVKDGFKLSGIATFDPDRYLTTVFVPGANYKPGALKKRIVTSGKTWSAIKDNTSDTMFVWGDVGGNLEVKKTYHLSSNAVQAIDKGNNNRAPAHDMDGQKRPANSGIVDIGADEIQGRL